MASNNTENKNEKSGPGCVTTIVAIILFIIFIWATAGQIIVYKMYGDKPITEIPAWALPYFTGG